MTQLIILAAALLGLIGAVILAYWLTKIKVKEEKVKEIAVFIREGSTVFLRREYKTLFEYLN